MMRTPRCLFVSLSIAGFCSSATALDFANIPLGNGSLIIGAGGEIEPGDSLKLTGFLEAVQAQKVVGYALDSPGGNVAEAEKLAAIIHGQNVTVGVTDGKMCASACFLLFAAGARRIASPSALIGVHSVSDGTGAEDLNTMGFTTAIARDASDYNVPAQIIGELVTTKPGQITWLSIPELTSMGVTFLRPDPPGMPSQQPVTSAAPTAGPGAVVAQAEPGQPATTPPSLSKATASIPATMSPAYISGMEDRKAWESWFGAQTGAARDGAAFWAGQRSLPHHTTCSAAGQANPQDWVTGCQQAAQMLGPFDVRRRREPDYKRGWNAI